MKSVHNEISLELLCRLFGKSRQAYYKLSSHCTVQQEWHGQLLTYVRKQRVNQPKLGTDKLQYLLGKEENIFIGRDALYNLLRDNGLLIKQPKKYRHKTTDGDGKSIYPDLRKGLEVLKINTLWSCDITYLNLLKPECHCYATFIVDECSHLIVGHTVAKDMTAQATLQALKMAVLAQGGQGAKFNNELIFHTDRGSQFKSALFQQYLGDHEIRCSMTQDGKPSDNPVSERLNGIIKNELIDQDHFDDFEQAEQLINQAVHIYNTRRPHRSCNMMTPQEAHQTGLGPLRKLWKQRRKTSKVAD